MYIVKQISIHAFLFIKQNGTFQFKHKFADFNCIAKFCSCFYCNELHV